MVRGVVSHGDVARYLSARGPSALPQRLGGPVVTTPAPARTPEPPAPEPKAERKPEPDSV